MAYGLHPQLYPYLYAPKNALSMSSSYDSIEPSHSSRHKSLSREKEDNDEKMNHDESSSGKGDEECAIDESENVEID
jgi:hypothetical protein